MKEIIALSNKKRTLERNQFLCQKGSIDTHLYYIEDGSVRIFIINGDEEQNIRFGYKGNFVVALDSFITGAPSNLYIQAIKKTEVRLISKKQIDEFIEQDGRQMLWTKMLEDLILQQMNREIDILTVSPKERYKRVMERSPQLFQEIPHRHIANYLRMSAETLSRLKKS